jgi:hypothetical protein
MAETERQYADCLRPFGTLANLILTGPTDYRIIYELELSA